MFEKTIINAIEVLDSKKQKQPQTHPVQRSSINKEVTHSAMNIQEDVDQIGIYVNQSTNNLYPSGLTGFGPLQISTGFPMNYASQFNPSFARVVLIPTVVFQNPIFRADYGRYSIGPDGAIMMQNPNMAIIPSQNMVMMHSPIVNSCTMYNPYTGV